VLNRIIQIRLRTELLGLGGMSRGPRAVVVVVLFDPGEDVAEPVEDASAHAKAAWAAALASFEAQGCDGQAGEVGGFGDREQPIVLIVRGRVGAGGAGSGSFVPPGGWSFIELGRFFRAWGDGRVPALLVRERLH